MWSRVKSQKVVWEVVSWCDQIMGVSYMRSLRKDHLLISFFSWRVLSQSCSQSHESFTFSFTLPSDFLKGKSPSSASTNQPLFHHSLHWVSVFPASQLLFAAKNGNSGDEMFLLKRWLWWEVQSWSCSASAAFGVSQVFPPLPHPAGPIHCVFPFSFSSSLH